MSTLVHEMVHLKQEEFGTPGRSGYHNEEWADEMEAIGLMPSHTGKPGGRRTGRQMSHYVIERGPFQQALKAMPEEYLLPWQSGTIPCVRKSNKNKVVYICPGSCGTRVWGRPHLDLICGACQKFFEALSTTGNTS
jgi:hypothetical protein